MKQLLLFITGCTFTIAAACQPLAEPTIQLKEKYIHLNTGVKLEYVEKGNASGIPVIFLHGLGDSWHSFEAMLPHLSPHIHAFAISQRGHGDSEKPSLHYSTHDFASDIAAFVLQRKLGPVIIAGHSMGGVNAQQFAINYPHLTKALVLIDSDAAFADNPGMPEFLQQSMQLEGSIGRPFMDEFQRSTLAKAIDPEYYNLLVDEGLKVPAEVFKAAFMGMMDVNFTHHLSRIKSPTLIFWGASDAFCSLVDQQQLMNGLTDARFIRYENTGHALHWEEPGRFATDLFDFASRVSH